MQEFADGGLQASGTDHVPIRALIEQGINSAKISKIREAAAKCDRVERGEVFPV